MSQQGDDDASMTSRLEAQVAWSLIATRRGLESVEKQVKDVLHDAKHATAALEAVEATAIVATGFSTQSIDMDDDHRRTVNAAYTAQMRVLADRVERLVNAAEVISQSYPVNRLHDLAGVLAPRCDSCGVVATHMYGVAVNVDDGEPEAGYFFDEKQAIRFACESHYACAFDDCRGRPEAYAVEPDASGVRLLYCGDREHRDSDVTVGKIVWPIVGIRLPDQWDNYDPVDNIFEID